MSLYALQKIIYQLNRDPGVRRRFAAERDALLAEYELDDEEAKALLEGFQFPFTN